MTSKDLSIFNSLRPFSVGFDDMFEQFESMLGNGGMVQSNYPPYNIRKAGKDKYAIEVAIAGFNKDDVEVEFEDNLLTVKTKKIDKCESPRKHIDLAETKRVPIGSRFCHSFESSATLITVWILVFFLCRFLLFLLSFAFSDLSSFGMRASESP